ncbi:SE-cephalotoxin [Labeo rohita]|uniref:SE-cephalotoxin n=1 Tax=Labeo rohita TaxID=84645 RepID=A0ABQ8L4G5_LABRO|nr:SE-cephalotoxin [Labeo rohita]
MATVKSFLTILYLLLYGCFCTADISISQVSQVEKGISLSKDFLQTINVVAGAISEYKEKDLASLFGMLGKVFHSLGKVAASIGFIGSLISFIFAFIPKSNPMFEFMKEQFAQVNRKLDSLSLQISTLQTEIEWTTYASTYGKDENVIKNSWAKLTEFIKTAPVASTQEEKTRLAERFTTFYENTGTENSIANFHRYLTENSPVSLNKNLLKLVIEKSNGDFNVLVQYSTYFTTLMVSGLKLNVFYYKLKGYDGEAKAQEAVTQLYNTLSSIQDALIECAGDFEKWAYKDAVKISSQRFSDTKTLTSDIKNHLERKFHWFKWVVIAHSKEAKNEFTFGRSIYVDVQEKTSVHLIHQEKGSAVDQIIKENVRSSLQKELSQIIPLQCETMKAKLLHRFGAKIISHTRFLHAVTKPSDYAQTDMADIEMNCQSAHRNFNFFLKGKNIVVKPPCSDVNCNNGECKSIKDTTIVFCKCHKMFHGPACEESVQNIINYESLEGEINAIMFKLVPDLTAIYFSIKELKDYTKAIVESVRHDIQWTQIFVKYSNVIQKFRYINTLHTQLKNSTINQRHYISEVGAQFTGGNSFEFYLTDFHQMMMGTGFGDRQNVLEFFHKSLVQDQSGGQAEVIYPEEGQIPALFSFQQRGSFFNMIVTKDFAHKCKKIQPLLEDRSTMNPASCLLYLRQDLGTIYMTSCQTIDVLQPLKEYIDYALLLSGSAFTMGIADKEPCNPTTPSTSGHFHTPTFMSGIVTIMPETSHAKPAKPKPAQVTPAKPKPAQVMSTKPKPAHITFAKPKPAHAMPAAPGPAHAMPTIP